MAVVSLDVEPFPRGYCEFSLIFEP